jgi:hypothetical protein
MRGTMPPINQVIKDYYFRDMETMNDERNKIRL